MFRAIQQVRRKRGGASIGSEGANLDAFTLGDGSSTAVFLDTESERLAPDIDDTVVPTLAIEEKKEEIQPDPTDLARRMRPTGQVGLDAYPSESVSERMIVEATVLTAETLVQSIVNEPILPEGDGVIVSIDHREGESALTARLRQEGLTVEVVNLTVGHVRISDQILIERKSIRDFVDNLLDGSLLNQVERLVESAPRPLLIIEGSGLFQQRAVSGQAIMATLATLTMDYGLPVVTSSDTAETAQFIAVSARRESKMLENLSEKAKERLQSAEYPDHVGNDHSSGD